MFFCKFLFNFFFKMVRIFILNFRLPCNLHTMLSQNLSQWSSLKNLPFHFIHLLQCVTSSSYWGKFPEESFWLIHRLDLWLQINLQPYMKQQRRLNCFTKSIRYFQHIFGTHNTWSRNSVFSIINIIYHKSGKEVNLTYYK